MITTELKESEDVRERLHCQLNLLKMQLVMQMKALDDKMVETTDVRIDFRGNLNETRIKKPSGSLEKKQSD